ncbi:hypothetical protein J2T21_001198 [Paeniglutamicibacter psychrophenolicus]|nr:hypothetical protein [Paeniglutamicibacter psychrophenolicus]
MCPTPLIQDTKSPEVFDKTRVESLARKMRHRIDFEIESAGGSLLSEPELGTEDDVEQALSNLAEAAMKRTGSATLK